MTKHFTYELLHESSGYGSEFE